MVELEGGAELSGQSDDGDDIARFERQCAARARAEGLAASGYGDEDEGNNSDEEDEPDERLQRARLAAGTGPPPKGEGEWRQRCGLLQEKLKRREVELSQAKADLDMVRSEGLGPGDPTTELKAQLVKLTKRNRALQATSEAQRTRVQQLEAEVRKPREEAKKQAEDLALNMGGDMEEWKKKYLTASNELQEVRHKAQELRATIQRQRKVLLKELGSDEVVEKALSVADDPNAVQFKGRAAQISQLQRQVRELKEQAKRPGAPADDPDSEEPVTGTPQQRRGGRADAAAEKERNALTQAADRRREDFDRLQEEVDRLRSDQAEGKRKRDAMKSRNDNLMVQLRELKASVQDLLRKSDNDDALVAALRRQLGRGGSQPAGAGCGGCDSDLAGPPGGVEELRRENAELQEQLERQAQIVLQLRQKSIAATCENGSARLGPQSVEAAAGERDRVVDRVRYLEAENARQLEQVRLLREQLGEDVEAAGRPFSAGSTLNLKEKLRVMGERLASVERENLALRRNGEDQEFRLPDESPEGSRSSSLGPIAAEQRCSSLAAEREKRARHSRAQA